MADRELARIAASQGGLVTWTQARDHLTRKQLESRLRTGALEIVRRGVYRWAGAAPDRWDELRAAVLAAGAGALVAHRAAAELWGMPGVVADRPHVLVPAPLWVRQPGVTCHQSTRVPDEHRTTRFGIAVTTPARTIVDVSSIVSIYLVGRITDDALRRGILRLDELRQAYELLARPGRKHLRAVRETLDARVPGYHPGDSDPERDVGRILVAAGLPEPVQQVPVPGTAYVLDWAYPELALGIEYDGWESHGTRSGFDKGALRANDLSLAGWQVLHFTSAASPSRIVRTVAAARERALRANTPSRV